jgi:hypothetical protein
MDPSKSQNCIVADAVGARNLVQWLTLVASGPYSLQRLDAFAGFGCQAT